MSRDYYTGRLHIMVFDTREAAGRKAGEQAARRIRDLLGDKEVVDVIFAIAPSRNETLKTLVDADEIDWTRVNAYRMDEYIDLGPGHPAGFYNYLKRMVFDLLPFHSINLINGNTDNLNAEALRYGGLLEKNPADICLLGVGENRHLAFNDPSVVDFRDPVMAKVVKLEGKCREQQVHDGCFKKLCQMPIHAVTVTTPGLMAAGSMIRSVPTATRAEAVRNMLDGQVSERCPASILTTHRDTVLYLDRGSVNHVLQYPSDGRLSMSVHFANAALIHPDRIEQGFVTVEGHRIQAVGTGFLQVSRRDQVFDLRGKYLSPGFVETHSHGAEGCDLMDGTAETVITTARTHLQHGITMLFPTTLAVRREEILSSINGLRSARRIMTDSPKLPGLHIGGPYLNPRQKGAIDEEYIRNPQREGYREFIFYGEDAISRWTLALELPRAMEFTRCLIDHGIVPSVSHTNAEYSQVLEVYHNGISHVTHLYFTMSGMVKKGGFRYPSLIESAFCVDDLTMEVIADGCHLSIEILEMVYRIKGSGKMALACDSMCCAGRNVKESVLGSLENGQRVIIEDDVAKMPDRMAFAGGIAADDRLVRVMYRQAKVPLWDCVRMMSLTPAAIMEIGDQVGNIMSGETTNLVCFDENIRIDAAMVRGDVVYGSFESGK